MEIENLLNKSSVQKLIDSLENNFDPFRTLQIEHYELRHTATLAWLLNSKASHKLGSTFIEAFLKALPLPDFSEMEVTNKLDVLHVLTEVPLVRRNSGGPDDWSFGYGRAQQDDEEDLLPSNETEPSFGRKRLDLLLDATDWSIAIEAKIKSKEGDKQLLHYHSAFHEYSKNKLHKLCLFLTLHEDSPRTDGWININWKQHIADPLRRILSDNEQLGSDEIRKFLKHYLALIDRLSGNADNDNFTKQINCVLGEAGMADLIRSAKAQAQELSASGTFSPLVLRHKALLELLFRNPPNARHRFALFLLKELQVKGGGISQIAEVTHEGFGRFFPKSWFPNDLAYNENLANKVPLFFYSLEVKDVLKNEESGIVEVKIYFPAGKSTSLQKCIWEKLRDLKISIFAAKGTRVFINSGKLFSNNFVYSFDENRELMLDDTRWETFVKEFKDVASRQWDTIKTEIDECKQGAAANPKGLTDGVDGVFINGQ